MSGTKVPKGANGPLGGHHLFKCPENCTPLCWHEPGYSASVVCPTDNSRVCGYSPRLGEMVLAVTVTLELEGPGLSLLK